MSEVINYNGAILFEGPSAIDGREIVVIMTGLKDPSGNQKTGRMLQTWVLLKDVHPSEALARGLDYSICGLCPHRYQYDEFGNAIRGTRSCYVRVSNAPRAVWECYQRGGYLSADEWHIFTGQGKSRKRYSLSEWLVEFPQAIRFGSYGDPVAAPIDVWRTLASYAKHRTGYTHQWRSEIAAEFKGLLQASCDSLQDFLEATAHGWSTFTVVPKGAAIPKGMVHCQASEEAGHKTSCERCHLCSGDTANVGIHAHGANAAAVRW